MGSLQPPHTSNNHFIHSYIPFTIYSIYLTEPFYTFLYIKYIYIHKPDIFAFHLLGIKYYFHPGNDHFKANHGTFTVKHGPGTIRVFFFYITVEQLNVPNENMNIYAFHVFGLNIFYHP